MRLPVLTRLNCPAANGDCTLAGRDLFLIAALGDTPDLMKAIALPPGFVGDAIPLPRPSGHILYLRLRDAPETVVATTIP